MHCLKDKWLMWYDKSEQFLFDKNETLRLMLLETASSAERKDKVKNERIFTWY